MKKLLFTLTYIILIINFSCTAKKEKPISIKKIHIEAEEFNVSYPKLLDWIKEQKIDTFRALSLFNDYTFQMDTNAVVTTSDNIIYTISSDKKYIAFVGKNNGEGWIKYKLAGKQEKTKHFVVNLDDDKDSKYIQLINTNKLPDVTLIQYGKTIKNFNIKDIKLPAFIIGGWYGCMPFDMITNDISEYHNYLPQNINYYLFTTDSVINKADTALSIYSYFYKVTDDGTKKMTEKVKLNNSIFKKNIYKILPIDFTEIFRSSPAYIYVDNNGIIKSYNTGGPPNEEQSRKWFLINIIKKLRSL